jgi:hypothetical protein
MSDMLEETDVDEIDVTTDPAEAADVTPDLEATPGAGETAPGEEETPAAWVGPSREEWERTQGSLEQLGSYAPVLGMLGEALSGADQQADPLAELAQLDPFDEGYSGRFANGLLGAIGQLLDDRLGPVSSIVEEREEQQAQETVASWYAEAAKPYGEVLGADSQDVVEMLALGVAVKDKVDGKTALGKAAEQYAGRLKAAHKAGRESLRAELEQLGQAPREVGTGGGGVTVERAAGDELEAAARFIEARNL